jgi:hypothetical protein
MSAKSLLSLFSSSELKTFTPSTTRNFYTPTPSSFTSPVDESPGHDRRRRKRRRIVNTEWTCAEIRALETYKALKIGDEFDEGLRDLLLPKRSTMEVKFQLARIEDTIRKKSGRKLDELEMEENELFVKEEKIRSEEMERDVKRRRVGMDDLLGLDDERSKLDGIQAKEARFDATNFKFSLDDALGLVEESEEQRTRREMDTALGLRWGVD